MSNLRTDLIGKQMRAFYFPNDTDDIGFLFGMQNVIDMPCTIESVDEDSVYVKVNETGNQYYYPLSMVDDHLIPEGDIDELINLLKKY